MTYTPTTEQIESAVSEYGAPTFTREEFRAWLAEHDAALIEKLATEAGYSLVYHEEAEAFLRREARQRREGKM